MHLPPQHLFRIAHHFDLGDLPGLLEPFTNDDVDIGKIAVHQRRQRQTARSGPQYRLVRRHQHHRVRPGLSMTVGVGPRRIEDDSRFAARLDHADPIAQLLQRKYDMSGKRRLAAVMPADK